MLVGAYHGIVTDNRDAERVGRIRVALPWLDGDVGEAYEARLATPMAGDGHGWCAMPQVGDAVVVMFVGGDPTRPVALGGVWSSVDAAPEGNSDGANAFRGYRSRSGHRLVLDDSARGKVVVVDRGGALLAIGQFVAAGQGANGIAAPRPAGAADTGVAVAAPDGAIELVATTTLRITAGRDAVVTAATSIGVRAADALRIVTRVATVDGRGGASLDAPEVELG
jgi:phage baseplate assembly protein gpV